MKIEDLIEGLSQVAIPTADLTETILFYSELGFLVQELASDPETGGQIAYLSQKGLTLRVYEVDTLPESPGPGPCLSLEVKDIQEMHEALEKRALAGADNEIRQLPFGAKGLLCFTIQGPSKETVEFCQRL